MAELAHENPVVIAAFMADSIEYYHENRDVALSYLARLESGFRARVENPELAAELDSDARSKEIAHELIVGVDLDSDSPEAKYLGEVISYLQSVGCYDELVLPAQQDEEFMAASANVYWAGYQARSSANVIGALTADGAKYFRSNPQLGIDFLDKVAKKMKRKNEESLGAEPDVSVSANYKGIEKHNKYVDEVRHHKKFQLNKDSDYHDLLDAVSRYAQAFIEKIVLHRNASASKERSMLYAELLVFVTACKARNDLAINIHRGNWNTFQSSIENRMLCIRDDGHDRSGITTEPDSSESLVSFASTYSGEMDKLEDLLEEQGVPELVRHLTREMGGDPNREAEFVEFINELSTEVASTLIPQIVSLC